ncbi:MAG TPA: type IV pilus biogenesis/stability protein PilW [Steroidobacteraceae bacterium]|nr:type IV pilus biogenesis/stability protein PilW [Steroidobacteraceae bacterium]
MSARAALLAVALLVAAQALAQSQPTDPTQEAGRINARLAMEYLKRGQLQVAQEKIEKALVQNPRDVNVQLAAGLVYERLRENKTAEKHFRQAVKAAPESPEAQNALGAYLCRNKQQAKGEEMFVKAANNPLYRTPFVAYTNAGVCARSAGQLERAERYLRQALTSQVDYPETFAQLAGVLHDRGNNLQARAFVERFLAIAPATPDMLLLGYNIEVAMKDQAAAAGFRARLEKEFPDSDQARRVASQPDRNPG